MFRHDHPVAWAYHRRTSRWPFNMHGLNEPTRETPAFKEDFDAACLELEPPTLPEMSLASALARRSSCRRFAPAPIDRAELGTALHAGYGVLEHVELWGEFCVRPVPSGGGLYPLELYVLAQRVQSLEVVSITTCRSDTAWKWCDRMRCPLTSARRCSSASLTWCRPRRSS